MITLQRFVAGGWKAAGEFDTNQEAWASLKEKVDHRTVDGRYGLVLEDHSSNATIIAAYGGGHRR